MKEIIIKYIQLAIDNGYKEKEIEWEATTEDILYDDEIMKHIIESKIYQVIVIQQSFIEAIAKGIMPIWHYRDEWTCIRDIIDKQALAIYKDNFDKYIIDILRLDNK